MSVEPRPENAPMPSVRGTFGTRETTDETDGRKAEDERHHDPYRGHDRPLEQARMKANETSHGENARAPYEDAKEPLLPIASASGDVPAPPLAVPGRSDGEDDDPRSLLAELRSLDGQLEANLRLVSDLKETENTATNAAKSPARSLEEARATALQARSFLAVNEGTIREAEARINTLTQEKRRLLEQMAGTGFFEGRWVNDDGRALFLKPTATAPPGYELHEAPWGWVKDAPPGEDPREASRRGPILQRAHHRRNQTFLLFGVPFVAYSIVTSLPPPLAHYSVAAVLVTVAALLIALPLAREFLLGRMLGSPHSERRLIEEEAASAQLYLITRGEKEPPSLEEITEAMLVSLRKRRGHEETIRSINVVEDPRKPPRAAGHTGASTPGEERDAQ